MGRSIQAFLEVLKYQGALDGFGVAAGFAGSSSGAATRIDHTTKKTVNRIKAINSI